MEPSFFGEPSRRLFGIYHPPAAEVDRPVGLVLCHPWGQEQIRAHRALMQLAKQLSQSGHHVLRFDCTGCGDSDGAVEDGRVEVWLADIAIAVEELTRVDSSVAITDPPCSSPRDSGSTN